MRLHFDLNGYDAAHRQLWKQRLEEFEPTADIRLEKNADDADYVFECAGRHSFIGGRVFRVASGSHYLERPESTFAWDAGDFPTGLLPGLYCSLSQGLFDPKRHRSFCYPLRYNRHLRSFPLEETDHLFGFCGSTSSPLRHRILTQLAPSATDGTAILETTTGIWGSWFDRSSEEPYARYADVMRRCRFILCPRGNGLSSIRLFETMESGRVPVILSDELVLPQCVAWPDCSIRVAEKNLAALPQLLRAHEHAWSILARNARREWERNFSNASILPRLADELTSILSARNGRESPYQLRTYRRIASQFVVQLGKTAVRNVQAQVARRRH